MAKITEEEVRRLAELAKIEITDEETEKFADQIEQILKYVEQLQKIDVEGVEPTSQVTGLEDQWRKDEEWDYDTTPEELLENAPSLKDNYIKVRRVL